MKKEIISKDQMVATLDSLYTKAIKGIPGSNSATEMAKYYLNKYKTIDKAARKLINNQIAKCSMSGFITNLGGLITLPVAIPANMSSVLYIQIRMIAAIAFMAGYDISNDEVQTLVYSCLTGASIAEICKSAGVQIANKATLNLVKKIPGTATAKINRIIGFKLITKFGEKSVFTLGKMVPAAGGLVGAGIDLFQTKDIGNRAYKVFIVEDFE